MSIFCKTCGASNEDDALFCSSCGNAFEQKKPEPAPVAQPVSEPVSVPAAEPVASAPVNEAPPASANPDPARNQGFNVPPQGAPGGNYQTPPPPPPPYMGGYNAFGGTPNNGSVSFGQAISLYFKNYATFSGRASKSEYWFSYLFTFIISTIISFFSGLFGAIEPDFAIVFNILSTLFSLATFLPSLACSVRRLHDTGKSGAYYFISLIPIVGIILLIIQLAKDSEWDNQWGPGNPQNSRPPVSFYTAVTYVNPPYGAPYGQQPPVYNNPYQNPYQNNQQGGNYPPNQPPMA